MALKGISNSEHGKLLGKISQLSDMDKLELEKELKQFYKSYHQQLWELSRTIEAYDTVAAKVRIRKISRRRDELVTI